MLVIRREQMKAFEQAAFNDYVKRMMAHLREENGSDLPKADDELRRLILAWIEDAKSWDITLEEDVTPYLELCAANADLRKKPAPDWVKKILEPPRPPDWKLTILEDAIFLEAPG
jgi:hypothetical protein